MRDSASPHILSTAALAVAALIVALGWQLGGYRAERQQSSDRLEFVRGGTKETHISGKKERAWRDELAKLGLIATSTPNIATSSDPLGQFGDVLAQEFLYGYISLKDSGTYSPERGAELGSSLGTNVRAPSGYALHAKEELTLDADTSVARVLKYRSDMREASAILITTDPPEFEIFARYIETNNPERLRDLERAEERYRDAEGAVLAVIVPEDAADVHIRVVNALGSFAHTLRQLIRYADSPLTSLAVLRTYNEAEREMLYAFDALSSYYVRKSTEN